MTDFTDSMEFFVVYLIVSLILFGLAIFFYITYKKGHEWRGLKVIICILIAISLIFYMVSSFTNLEGTQIPPRADFKFVFTMTFFFLLLISVYLFLSLFFKEDDNYYSEQEDDTEESEMEDIEYTHKINSHTISFEPNYEGENSIENKFYPESEQYRFTANKEDLSKDKDLQELEQFVNTLFEKQKRGKTDDN